MAKPVPTGASHTLPFEKLSPLDFERLCLWLVSREGYERAEHLGEAGGEEGRDVVAWKAGRRFVFQCKRVQSFTAGGARKEIQKLRSLPASEQPHELVFVVSRAVSAATRSSARAAWGDEATCHFWAGSELDALVKRHPELLEEFFQLPPVKEPAPFRHNLLLALAGKVEEFWFGDIPEQRRLHIRWEKRPDAVGRPGPERAFAEVAASELVKPVHEHFLGQGRSQGWSLLILGDPGSGKTVALLELARGLARDPSVGVPVVFHLASWKGKDRSLAAWMARELAQRYQAGSKAAPEWLDGRDGRDQILPLLDGLDEVEPDCRPGCVDAINDYLEERGLHTILAVTCHTRVYEQLPVHLQLETAVALRPLDSVQIDEYLGAAGPALAGLRAALTGDAGLRELATSPLLLALFERTFWNAPPEDLPSGGTTRIEQVFEAYVARVLEPKPKLPRAREEAGRFRRLRNLLPWNRYEPRTEESVAPPPGRYPPPRARRSLAWLARGMAEHDPALFQVERLQPAWLTSGWQVFAYAVLSRSLGGCLLGLPIALAFEPKLAAAALLAGAMVGAVEMIRLRRRASPAGSSIAVVGRWIGWTLLLGGVAFLAVLLLGIPFWVDAASWRFSNLVRVSLLFGLLFGSVFSVRGTGRGGHRDIRVAEALVWTAWSWRGTALGASSLAILSLACWVLFLPGSDASLSYLRGPDFWVPFSLIAALLGGLLFGAFGGLEGKALEKKAWPNLGTWLALRNACIVGLRVGLATMLGLGLVLGALAVAGRIPQGLLFWIPLKTGLAVGIWSGLAYSGLDFVQHFSLRLVIRLAKLMPGRLIGFLDHAVERGLLKRPGGSYQFYHPLLGAWFANRKWGEGPSKGREQSSPPADA